LKSSVTRGVALDSRISAQQRCRTAPSLISRIFLIAGTKQRAVDEPHHRRHDGAPSGVRRRKCGAHGVANPRQRTAEASQPFRLGLIAERLPVGMVTVLQSAFGIAPDCLDVGAL
jgi:hypothetical protein